MTLQVTAPTTAFAEHQHIIIIITIVIMTSINKEWYLGLAAFQPRWIDGSYLVHQNQFKWNSNSQTQLNYLGPVAPTTIKLEPSSNSTLTLVQWQFSLHHRGSALNARWTRFNSEPSSEVGLNFDPSSTLLAHAHKTSCACAQSRKEKIGLKVQIQHCHRKSSPWTPTLSKQTAIATDIELYYE